MRGRSPPHGWADGGLRDVEYKLGDVNDTILLEVNNVLTEIQIHNVFGVVKGLIDPGMLRRSTSCAESDTHLPLCRGLK